jgi:hypothetical protein
MYAQSRWHGVGGTCGGAGVCREHVGPMAGGEEDAGLAGREIIDERPAVLPTGAGADVPEPVARVEVPEPCSRFRAGKADQLDPATQHGQRLRQCQSDRRSPTVRPAAAQDRTQDRNVGLHRVIK